MSRAEKLAHRLEIERATKPPIQYLPPAYAEGAESRPGFGWGDLPEMDV